MKKLALCALAIALLSPAFASAADDVMPAPNRAPHTPVHRQPLNGSRPAMPETRDVQDVPLIMDGEKLQVSNYDLRLFGIVPPQLSASFGPQARNALDQAAGGQPVSCHIRDRDRDGRLLATCKASNGTDLALSLLQRGLAVTARGSLADTEFAQPYIAAEQAAAAQKLGLWSVMQPDAAVAMPEVKLPTAEAKKDDVKKDDKVAKADVAAVDKPLPFVAPLLIKTVSAATVAANDDAPPAPGFLARYQLLAAGLLVFITAIGVLGALGWQKRQEKRNELKALAAALRGELMAARAVCHTRLKSIRGEDDDKNLVWPRLRATLYQAYVGRLGWLGAELARQVASIYGQASDYAAYYNANGSEVSATPKKQALQTLASHIDQVLPKLEKIENKGSVGSAVALRPDSQARNASNMKAERTRVVLPVPVDPDVPTIVPVVEEIAMVGTSGPAQVTGPTTSPAALWDAVRKFANEHFAAERKTNYANDELMPDYAALIEQEMASMSYDSDGDNFSASDIKKTG